MSASHEVFERPAAQPVLTVSALTALVKEVVDGTFPLVWVSGEISGFKRAQSGHCYLTLKDDAAVLSAVIWRSTASTVRCDLNNGLEVICRGHLDVYVPRGEYKLIIEEILPKGLGALEQALRKLREKLNLEGLFDKARKRPLPAFPRRIAFVTSPTGAAIRDFLEVLRRRWRGADVLVVPVPVQGIGAAEKIAEAIVAVNRLNHPIDVLVVGRGGGSLEDLWAFNEEAVVRAIHASRIPVVSAVGHEIDVTLADLVADLRALTPSEAAERIVPAIEQVLAGLRNHHNRLAAALKGRVADARAKLEGLTGRRVLREPFDRLHDLARQLDLLGDRAVRAVRNRLSNAQQRAAALAGQLESLSPLGVLARGYSLTTRLSDGRLIEDAAKLSPGERIKTRFARGTSISRVEEIADEPHDMRSD